MAFSQHGGSVAAVTVTTTTETVVGSTPSNFEVAPYGSNIVSGTINFTAGTGTTAVVLRVRQGNTTSGTLIAPAQTITLAAAASANIPFEVEDLAPVAGNTYCVTVQQTGATGNGTGNYTYIKAYSAQGHLA